MGDSPRDRTLTRIDKLIAGGQGVIARAHKPANWITSVDGGRFQGWRTQGLAFLKAALGADHLYTAAFESNVKDSYPSQSAV